ncbi:MAG: hypothetical protein Q4D21_05960 [Phascolarctobacterium sp.]|nr:hypothetical protein [Phascolarctobacterium sp.]
MLSKMLKRTVALALVAVTFGLPLASNDALAAPHNKGNEQRVERRTDNLGSHHSVSRSNNHRNDNNGHQIHRDSNRNDNRGHQIHRDSNRNDNNGHQIRRDAGRNDNHRDHDIRRSNGNRDHRVSRPGGPDRRGPSTPPRPQRVSHRHSSHGDWLGGLIIGTILGTVIANNNVDV